LLERLLMELMEPMLSSSAFRSPFFGHCKVLKRQARAILSAAKFLAVPRNLGAAVAACPASSHETISR
jgi:hypothetical protein